VKNPPKIAPLGNTSKVGAGDACVLRLRSGDVPGLFTGDRQELLDCGLAVDGLLYMKRLA